MTYLPRVVGYVGTSSTEEGKNVAENIYERHNVLAERLVGISLDKKTAAVDFCRLEHNLSLKFFERLKEDIQTSYT